MHMQTHEILRDAPTVNVYGVGYRKGEVAMLQFVKDCVTFRDDLERDDAERAARLLRPFISATPSNATEQLMRIPAHPTMTIRDLFDSQPDQAPTPSDVAARAQSAVAALLYPALQPHQLLAPIQQNPSNETTSGTAAPFPHIVPASTLMQIRRKASDNVQTPSSHPSLSDRIRLTSNASNDAALHNVIQEGMRAAKVIFPRGVGSTTTIVPFPLSKMPDTKHFLDYERCRAVLRNANLSHVDFLNAWQAHRESVLHPVRLDKHAKAISSSDGAVQPDDSGVVMAENLQAQSTAHEVSWDHFALQMISPERPSQPHASVASVEHESRRLLLENESTPTLSAASTLLSLSPTKPSN